MNSYLFEKLEQDKYKIVQQSSQKVLTAQDNTAVFPIGMTMKLSIGHWYPQRKGQYFKVLQSSNGGCSSENTLQLSYNMPNESFHLNVL